MLPELDFGVVWGGCEDLNTTLDDRPSRDLVSCLC